MKRSEALRRISEHLAIFMYPELAAKRADEVLTIMECAGMQPPEFRRPVRYNCHEGPGEYLGRFYEWEREDE
jgi:hypothetical protein